MVGKEREGNILKYCKMLQKWKAWHFYNYVLFPGLICAFESTSKLIMMSNLPTTLQLPNWQEIHDTTESMLNILYGLMLSLKEWNTC